jgi:hypothetical protein
LICETENHSALASYSTQAPTTGSTITTTPGLRHLSLNPAATIATLTVNLPPYPRNNDTFEVMSIQTVTALTVPASARPTGQSVNGATQPISVGPGVAHSWRYNTSLLEWQQVS